MKYLIIGKPGGKPVPPDKLVEPIKPVRHLAINWLRMAPSIACILFTKVAVLESLMLTRMKRFTITS